MENYNVYEDIASRTNGDIYIGVVGPVRTGKSTFIKRFMERAIIPNSKENEKQLMIDELPQSASGKQVMTTEPKFVPSKGAKLDINDNSNISVRLVDCVGFPIEGASGFEDDNGPRLINTPWSDEPMPFDKAAILGTEKVINEHSTMGIVMTTDGSITELPRAAYVTAEEYSVKRLKEMGKPFVIILNCRQPNVQENLRVSLEEKYNVPVIATNVESMNESEIISLMEKVLFEFPVSRVDINLPNWVRCLPENDEMILKLMNKLKDESKKIKKMKDCLIFEEIFKNEDDFKNPQDISIDAGKGIAKINFEVKEGVFLRELSKICDMEITDDLSLIKYIKSLSEDIKKYNKIKSALNEAEETGYGMVVPNMEDMELTRPVLMKKGAGYGVKFRSKASSYHILKIDINSEVTPVTGTQQQGEDFLRETNDNFDNNISKVWDTNIFGRSLKELMNEGCEQKMHIMPEDVKNKMRKTITRIVNEGRGGVICILL